LSFFFFFRLFVIVQVTQTDPFKKKVTQTDKVSYLLLLLLFFLKKKKKKRKNNGHPIHKCSNGHFELPLMPYHQGGGVLCTNMTKFWVSYFKTKMHLSHSYCIGQTQLLLLSPNRKSISSQLIWNWPKNDPFIPSK
jgi:hypothetical protein